MIINFIRHFQYPDTIDVFTRDMCYWFAAILRDRFGGEIFYTQASGHFVCRIAERLYDVTGDVTELYEGKLISWDAIYEYDDLLYERLMRDCVRKEPV